MIARHLITDRFNELDGLLDHPIGLVRLDSLSRIVRKQANTLDLVSARPSAAETRPVFTRYSPNAPMSPLWVRVRARCIRGCRDSNAA